MGDSCWPRDAQACLVRSGFGGLVARKEVERRALHANRRSFSFGSDQSRAKRGDGRGWSDRRTGRERAPAQRSQSIALRVARMLVGAEQRPDGGSIRSSSLAWSSFFFPTCFFCARCSTRGTRWPDASMLGGFSRRSRRTRRRCSSFRRRSRGRGGKRCSNNEDPGASVGF